MIYSVIIEQVRVIRVYELVLTLLNKGSPAH
jgi:hypothetical protein